MRLLRKKYGPKRQLFRRGTELANEDLYSKNSKNVIGVMESLRMIWGVM
jgi:hypothetical protein